MLKRCDNRNQKFVMGYSAAYPMGAECVAEEGTAILSSKGNYLIDADSFLSPIKKVEVVYVGS